GRQYWPRPRFCLVLSGAANYWLFRLRNPLSSTPKLFNPPWPSQIGRKIGGSAYWIFAQVNLPTFTLRQEGSNFEPLYRFLSASIASKIGTNLFITFPVVGHSTGASQSSRGLKNSSPEVSHPPSG